MINLKGRMDTELGKVTKRNNFLVEELESWKQQVSNYNHICCGVDGNQWQFLKFQAFAEQLTKETQDLKVKIENHKRENRRLTGLIDQQKDDAARLQARLTGTEKQRDDALEALVLQQEIAEELELERQRNKKELSALQHTNMTILRQRDEAQRVVLHLRSLISGQTHHMEHLVRTIGDAPELQEYIDRDYDDEDADVEDGEEEAKLDANGETVQRPRGAHKSAEDMTPDMEARLNNGLRNSKRWSTMSIVDVADRHLRDKTDAIAHIIRNISEQCAAAVEGLQLAHDAEVEAEERSLKNVRSRSRMSLLSTAASEDAQSAQGSEVGEDGLLQPSGRISSIPPTPDLIHNRSSTAMSMSSSTTTPERNSQQYHADIPTKIVEDSDEDLDRSETEGFHDSPVTGKAGLLHRPAGARISALGGH